jgi:hypothetical protein
MQSSCSPSLALHAVSSYGEGSWSGSRLRSAHHRGLRRERVNEDFDPGFYTPDWHLHRSEEKYLEHMEKYLVRIDEEWNDKPLR